MNQQLPNKGKKEFIMGNQVELTEYEKYLRDRRPVDPSTAGMVRIAIDVRSHDAAMALVQAEGARALLRYIYRAINDEFHRVGEPRFAFPGEFKSPYLAASFDHGPRVMELTLINCELIKAVAEKQKQSASEFVMAALKAWSQIPKGMALD